MRDLAGRFDLVAWVPVSRKRRRERGYDQAQLLAEQVADLLQMPVCHCLKKVRDNPPQSGVETPEERRKNVRGRYMPLDPEQFENKRILLVDDVITTGETMEECSRVLCTAGAEQVVCAALAMTK